METEIDLLGLLLLPRCEESEGAEFDELRRKLGRRARVGEKDSCQTDPYRL